MLTAADRESLAQRMNRIAAAAERRDVTYEVDNVLRFVGRQLPRSAIDKIHEVRRRGCRSEALKWLRSATPAGMVYGTFPSEERIKAARSYADRAGLKLEDLAVEAGLLGVLA